MGTDVQEGLRVFVDAESIQRAVALRTWLEHHEVPVVKRSRSELLLHVQDPAAGVNVTELLLRWFRQRERGVRAEIRVGDTDWQRLAVRGSERVGGPRGRWRPYLRRFLETVELEQLLATTSDVNLRFGFSTPESSRVQHRVGQFQEGEQVMSRALPPYGAQQFPAGRVVDGLRGAGARPSTAGAENDELRISIYLSDAKAHERVEEEVDRLLEVVGLEVTHRSEPIMGSWFRRVRARVKAMAGTPAAQDAMRSAAHALDTRLVHTADAEVTAKLLQNLGPVLDALQHTENAVLRVGALLIVKQGESVAVHQLTADQQLKLDHHPRLAYSPQEIQAALQLDPADPATAGVDGPNRPGSGDEARPGI